MNLNNTDVDYVGLLLHGFFFNKYIWKFLRDLRKFEKTHKMYSLKYKKN